MKLYILAIFFVLFIGIVRADVIDINLERENYLSRETFQANLIVNNELDSNINVFNLKLTKNGIKIPIAFFINKINDNFYRVYFQIPSSLIGEYELRVSNINYYDNNILKQRSFSKNFSIDDGNGVSISEGVLLLNKGETKVLEVNNYGNDLIQINIDKSGDNILLDKNNLQIENNLQNSLQIIIDKNKEYNYLNSINLSYADKSYNILLLYLGDGKSTNNTNNFNSTVIVNNTQGNFSQEIVYDILNFDDPSLKIDKQLNDNEGDLLNGWIDVRNFGDKDISGINFFVEGNVRDLITIKNELNDIKANSMGRVFIDINKEHTATPGIYEGYFVLNYSVFEHKIPIRLEYVKNELLNETIINPGGNGSLEDLLNNTRPVEEIKDKSLIPFISILLILFIALVILIIAYKKRNASKKSF